jgi:hypothetical protein
MERSLSCWNLFLMNSLYKGCQKIKDSGLLKKKKISTAKKERKTSARHQWLMPIILATWEPEIRRILV